MDEQTVAAEQADKRAEVVAALREFADWLEEHPTAKNEITSTGVFDYQTGRDEFVEQVRALKAEGWEQVMPGRHADFELSRSWGPITYRLYTKSEHVCEERTVARPTTEWIVSPSFLEEIKRPSFREIAAPAGVSA